MPQPFQLQNAHHWFEVERGIRRYYLHCRRSSERRTGALCLGHAPIFEIRVVLKTGESAVASAGSKRVAQQAAAQDLLTKLEQ